MAAYWYDRPREPENTTMWTAEGALYLINITHPLMQEEYYAFKRRHGIRFDAPLGDRERWVWEADIISRYGNVRKMPEHIVRRILLPPYRGICEVAGVDIDALYRRIKKGPPKRSAVT